MKKLLLTLCLLALNVNADIRQDLGECQKEKNKLMLKLIPNYQNDQQWVESNKQFITNNHLLLSKAIEILPEIKEQSNPWPLIWENQLKLREDATLNEIFNKHNEYTKKRDAYISKHDDQYKKICLRIEQLRKDLAESYKKK
jgi:hypothetical protein